MNWSVDRHVVLDLAPITFMCPRASAQRGQAALVRDHIDIAYGGRRFGDIVAFPTPVVNPTFSAGFEPTTKESPVRVEEMAAAQEVSYVFFRK